MFIKCVKPHIIGCESRMCSAVLVGSAAGNSCQKFQNQSVIPTWMLRRSRAVKSSQVPGNFLQFQLSTREIFPGLPVRLLSVVFMEAPRRCCRWSSSYGRVWFQGKKSRKITKLKNQNNIYEGPAFHKLRGRISCVLNWKMTPIFC